MTYPRDDLLRALRGAYATERYAERLLRNHATKSTPYPEVKARRCAAGTGSTSGLKSISGPSVSDGNSVCLDIATFSDPFTSHCDGLCSHDCATIWCEAVGRMYPLIGRRQLATQ